MASGGFHNPLQQLFLLEERVRQAGVHLPDEADLLRRFHGIKCVVCGVDCVINMREVAEVFDDRQVTPIPGTARWIEGVMNYRGTLVPVYLPHEYLGAGDKADEVIAACNGPLLVLRKDRKGTEFNAIRVNRMFGMQKFRLDEVQPLDKGACPTDILEHYVDEIVCNDGKDWYRLQLGRLLDRMNSDNPHEQ